MKRCPKCNCGAECTNNFEYYGAHAVTSVIGIGAGLAASLVHPSSGGHTAAHVHHELTKGVKKHYKCTNSGCGYEWDED